MARPQTGDYFEYYQRYIDQVQGGSIEELVNSYSAQLNQFIMALPEGKAEHSYGPGKWTVKEVMQHLIDTERVFGCRALRFARKDATPLPGFDENEYAAHGNASSRSLASLKEEFVAVRKSTDLMLLSFGAEQLAGKGTASGHAVTVNAIAFIIFGHVLHHRKILEERYLA